MRCVHQLHAVNFPVERPPAILDVAFIVLSTLLIIIDILFEMMHDPGLVAPFLRAGRVVTHGERAGRAREAGPAPARPSLTSLDLSNNQLGSVTSWGSTTYTTEGMTAIADALRVLMARWQELIPMFSVTF